MVCTSCDLLCWGLWEWKCILTNAMYPVCILFVSYMYNIWILYVSYMHPTCILYVICMYPICILYVTHMYTIECSCILSRTCRPHCTWLPAIGYNVINVENSVLESYQKDHFCEHVFCNAKTRKCYTSKTSVGMGKACSVVPMLSHLHIWCTGTPWVVVVRDIFNRLQHSCWRVDFWHCGRPAKYVNSCIYT